MVRALRNQLGNKFLRKRKTIRLKPVVFVVPAILAGVCVIVFLLPLFAKMGRVAQTSSNVPGLHGAAEVPAVQFFKDVDSGHVAFKAVAYLKQHDMIEGYPDGTFRPEALVSRAELLKFLFEAQKIYPSPAVYRACFKDVRDQWFAAVVCYAKAKNLLEGGNKTRFQPGDTIKTADALKIILSAFNLQTSDIGGDDALLTRGKLATILYHFLS